MFGWASGFGRAVTRHPGLASGIVCRVTARPKPEAQPNIPKHAPNPTY